jgi:hypothetical protein
MTAAHVQIAEHVADHAVASLAHSPSCWDPETECQVVFAHPMIEPELWRDFVNGAIRSYTARGVDKALDYEALHSGSDTILFAACVDRAGRVVGGLRAKGPYQSADEAHALLEWEGQPGQDLVHKMITDRIPFGVCEMKTAWVTDDPDRSRLLTYAISRTPLHAMGMLDIQFIVATAASYVLKRWLSSGGIIAKHIPPTPYPDERYDTRLAWWDRLTFAKHADPKQLSLYFAEQQQMTPRLEGVPAAAATGTGR